MSFAMILAVLVALFQPASPARVLVYQTNSGSAIVGHYRPAQLSPVCWYAPTHRALEKLPKPINDLQAGWVALSRRPAGVANCSTTV